MTKKEINRVSANSCGGLLTPTHQLTLTVGIAFTKEIPETNPYSKRQSYPLRYWEPKKLTVTFWKDPDYNATSKYEGFQKASRHLKRATEVAAKQAFPEASGSFIYQFSWNDAIRIAPDPVLPDLCGCELGIGGGIYQPDVFLDIRFGIALPLWVDPNTGKEQTPLAPKVVDPHPKATWAPWQSDIMTLPACTNRNDLDDTYLSKVEQQHHFQNNVGYFIVEKMWDKARKYLFNYEKQWEEIE